jgi:hypothetical protein
VNANPSVSRTPSTGSWGGLDARRELAAAAGPSLGIARVEVRAGLSGRALERVNSTNGGSRHAKKACRGALNPRCAAQGRVGDKLTSRHVAHHLVIHLLLSARTSATADAVRPRFPGQAWPWLTTVSMVRNAASRPKAQPAKWHTPPEGACDTKLVRPGPDVIPTSACAQSRGKGVQAA